MATLELPPAAREQITVGLALIDAHDAQLVPLDQDLRGSVTAAPGIPVGYATLAAFYVCLIAAIAWILRRLARAPMATAAEPERALTPG